MVRAQYTGMKLQLCPGLRIKSDRWAGVVKSLRCPAKSGAAKRSIQVLFATLKLHDWLGWVDL